jgi:hypothetical protein
MLENSTATISASQSAMIFFLSMACLQKKCQRKAGNLKELIINAVHLFAAMIDVK